MTEEEQRIAIAEACGWERWKGAHSVVLTKPRDDKERAYWLSVGNTITDEPITEPRLENLPDYLHDLNAMHEAVCSLDEQQQFEWSYRLGEVIERAYPEADTQRHMVLENLATAAQRAEAFLKTLNLWKD